MAAGENAWTTVDDGSLTSVKTLDFDPQNPNHAFAATDAGIMLSDDGGQTWHLFTTYGVNSTRILKVHPLNSQYMIQVDIGNSVNISRDGGSTWHALPSGISSFAFDNGGADSIIPDVSAEGMFFLFEGTGTSELNPVLHVNVATGKATVISCSAYVSHISALATVPSVVYLTTDHGLYRSTDGKTSVAVPGSANIFTT